MATVGERFVDGPLNRDVIRMLSRGNTADPAPVSAALGRAPRPLGEALKLTPAYDADRMAGRLYFVRPLLRWSIAILWIATAFLSFGLYPVSESYKMLASMGLTGALADIALYGGALADLVLGVLLLMQWRPVLVGFLQLAFVMIFSLLATRLAGD
jgi:hypothetical protein